MENKPTLHEAIFKFYQDGNTNGSTAETEEIEITIESVIDSLDKIGGFYTIRSTTGFSINDISDLEDMFDQIKNIIY